MTPTATFVLVTLGVMAMSFATAGWRPRGPRWTPVYRTSTKTPEPAITDAGPVSKTYPLEENDSVKLMQQPCDTIGQRDSMP